ncbi:UNVERIFIED_CONTAM: hypothetical protein FKN15_024082 [Acipenser sinensis]
MCFTIASCSRSVLCKGALLYSMMGCHGGEGRTLYKNTFALYCIVLCYTVLYCIVSFRVSFLHSVDVSVDEVLGVPPLRLLLAAGQSGGVPWGGVQLGQLLGGAGGGGGLVGAVEGVVVDLIEALLQGQHGHEALPPHHLRVQMEEMDCRISPNPI